jgi:hypothetical protein
LRLLEELIVIQRFDSAEIDVRLVSITHDVVIGIAMVCSPGTSFAMRTNWLMLIIVMRIGVRVMITLATGLMRFRRIEIYNRGHHARLQQSCQPYYCDE